MILSRCEPVEARIRAVVIVVVVPGVDQMAVMAQGRDQGLSNVSAMVGRQDADIGYLSSAAMIIGRYFRT